MVPTIDVAEIPSLSVWCTTYPQGSYTTGCVDIMIGKDKDGSFFRLFYPTELPDIKKQPTKDWTRWFLGENYSEGWARLFMPYWPSLFRSLTNRRTRDVLVPAVWEAPIADKKFPVVVFSHGLMANRALYSCICSEIASHGFIVAAVEHRDESATATFTFSPEGEQEWIYLKGVGSKENEFEIREKQVEIRAKECSRILDVLERLNKGEQLTNEMSNSKFKLRDLKGTLDLSKPIVAGQSFGGASVILSLAKDSRFKLGIALDPWLFPLMKQTASLGRSIDQPILFVLMEEFQDANNLEALKPFQNERNEIHTIKKGIHNHQVDVGIVFCKDYVIFQKFAGGYSADFPKPELPMTLTNTLIMKFIFTHQGVHQDYVEACSKFLVKHENHVTNNAQGNADWMVGWYTLSGQQRSFWSFWFTRKAIKQ